MSLSEALSPIKCKNKSCNCQTKCSKDLHKWKKNNASWKYKKTSLRKTQFFREKSKHGRNKSNICFNCGKEGHYARQCLDKKLLSSYNSFKQQPCNMMLMMIRILNLYIQNKAKKTKIPLL